MPRLSEAQLAERASGLGATDVATAAGLNPYQTPLELYLTKIGELDPDATIDDAARERMERGHRLEDVALAWDADESGEPYERVNRTIWHPRLPFVFSHPDARRRPWSKTRRLVEVKTSNRRIKEVPRSWEAQVQVQMACTKAAATDIVVLTFDGKPDRFTIERDEQLIDALERLAAAFWDRVQRRDPPPMDGSSGATSWLNRTRWGDEPDIVANDVQRRLLAQLIDVRAQQDELAAEESRLRNVLADTMAGAQRLNARGIGRVHWTAPFMSRRTQWKEVAETFATELRMLNAGGLTSTDVDAVIADYTSAKETRQFRVEVDEREVQDAATQ